MAALGGVDRVVFSGRYADLAETLGPWLAERPVFNNRPFTDGLRWETFRDPVERIAADWALAVRSTEQAVPS